MHTHTLILIVPLPTSLFSCNSRSTRGQNKQQSSHTGWSFPTTASARVTLDPLRVSPVSEWKPSKTQPQLSHQWKATLVGATPCGLYLSLSLSPPFFLSAEEGVGGGGERQGAERVSERERGDVRERRESERWGGWEGNEPITQYVISDFKKLYRYYTNCI